MNILNPKTQDERNVENPNIERHYNGGHPSVRLSVCLSVPAHSAATPGAGLLLSLSFSRGERQQQEKQESADDSWIT